ncbi:MAG: hypothetical protein ACE5LU_20500 [Anaerolineae bacterium]
MNTKIGEAITVDDLLADGFDAVFLGTGSLVSVPLKAPGQDLCCTTSRCSTTVRQCPIHGSRSNSERGVKDEDLYGS